MSLIYCPIKAAAVESPHLPALILDGASLSYLELNLEIEKMQKKIPKGRLVIYHPLDFRLIILLFAAFREKIPVFVANIRLPFTELLKHATAFSYTHIIASLAETFTLNEIFQLPDIRDPSDPYLEEEKEAISLLTSGSTAQPKLTKLSLGNLYYNALGTIQTLSLQENDRYHLSLPLFHVSGLGILFRSFIAKAAVIISEAMLRFKPTHLSLVPTQLFRLLQSDLTFLKCILLGGAPISPHLYDEANKRGFPLYLTYGLTESASAITITKTPKRKNNTFYLGHPLPFREVKTDEQNEIFVRGKVLFQSNVWLPTKDIGDYDCREGLAILGRKDRMFISGGENIQPEEIERLLLEHPEIYEAIVVPKNDPEWDSVPIAFVRYVNKEKEILGSLKDRLPKYKIPHRVYDLKTLPQIGLKPSLKTLIEIANSAKF